MAKKVRQNFTIPEQTARKLRAQIPQRQRIEFVVEAINEKLTRLEEERLKQDLREGYAARSAEGVAINAEWEAATLERLP